MISRRAILIVKNPEDTSVAGARALVQALIDKTVTEVSPLPGRPIGCHTEDFQGTNLGLSSFNPPMKEGTTFKVEQLLGGFGCYIRLGPDLPYIPWAALVDVKGSYEEA
jgi:hypothetical protein